MLQTTQNAGSFFSLGFFRGDFVFLIWMFWKVLLGLGIYSDNFRNLNGCPLSDLGRAVASIETSTKCCYFWLVLFVFLCSGCKL